MDQGTDRGKGKCQITLRSADLQTKKNSDFRMLCEEEDYKNCRKKHVVGGAGRGS